MLIFSGEGGILNNLINKLPVELHIPGYQYCGPGTKLEKRLKRGDSGINPSDKACKVHDIAYSKHKNLEDRHKADYQLEQAAWDRFNSKDATAGERSASWFVTTAMKAKRKVGMGVGAKKSAAAKKKGGSNLKTFMKKIAAVAGRKTKKSRNRKLLKVPRVIVPPQSVSKVGGIIPLPLIFAGLSALGALVGGTAQVIKTAKSQAESVRHNKTMEAIAASKKGSALYLKPYKHKGGALYLKPYKQKGKGITKKQRRRTRRTRGGKTKN